MEEVPARVHPGPKVPDVLTRQHEHWSRLIWSGDYETCFTDLQCRCFGRNLFQCYSTAPRRLLCTAALGGARQIRGALVIVQIWAWSRISALQPQLMTDVQADPLAPLGIQLRGNDHTCEGTQHASHVEAWHQWRLHYREITRVYIGNPANRDTHSVSYQPGGVDRRMMTSMLQEVDDMDSVVIQEPPSSPSQMAVFAKKGQMIIRRCMPSHRHPWEHVPDRGARGVKRGARRQPGRRVGDGHPHVPPFSSRPGHVDPKHVEIEKGEGSGQVEIGEGSGGGHPPASSSDNEEQVDDTDDVQRLGFGHRVGKKTTRLTPSDWP
ncbi:hypothetical protein M9H77_12557 [Catharanthus roseus]|uniref:Uncharacterized protein n=1 Tax=Catharanthus roseus TaxID=4058 RepID=A0ACC0BHW7_CATRO|nr:hypothetical protein M9H77_12557 [Catharanthus roseus]